MKLILLNDVKGHGKRNDIVESKDGFASFLIKKGDAVVFSSKSLDVLNKELDKNKANAEKILLEAKEMQKKLSLIKLEFKVKTGKDDKVFGSVSSKQIYEELVRQGLIIDKKNIKLREELNTLGNHIIKVTLHKDVTCDINVYLRK
ncbi:MAG: 50S ribosomal protein L9 [Bacilli bacterium]